MDDTRNKAKLSFSEVRRRMEAGQEVAVADMAKGVYPRVLAEIVKASCQSMGVPHATLCKAIGLKP